MRSLVIYIETVWLMALQALLFYLNFPPALLAACAAYKERSMPAKIVMPAKVAIVTSSLLLLSAQTDRVRLHPYERAVRPAGPGVRVA